MTRAHDIDRFQSLWRRCLLEQADDNSIAIHQQLIDAYSEPQRVYHTLKHIEHCLAHLDNISNYLQNPDAVELAIWYHDAIYKPGARNNEQLSADLFMETTRGRFDDSLRNTVYQHIMATLHDDSEFENSDTKFMVDIDLSSFGLPWPEFSQDSDNLRLEMRGLSDEDFHRRQSRFQQSLMERARLFKSDYFYENYEQQARQNLIDYFETNRQLKPD